MIRALFLAISVISLLLRPASALNELEINQAKAHCIVKTQTPWPSLMIELKWPAHLTFVTWEGSGDVSVSYSQLGSGFFGIETYNIALFDLREGLRDTSFIAKNTMILVSCVGDRLERREDAYEATVAARVVSSRTASARFTVTVWYPDGRGGFNVLGTREKDVRAREWFQSLVTVEKLLGDTGRIRWHE